MDISKQIRDMARQKNELPADLKRRLFGQGEKPVEQQVEEAYKRGYEQGAEQAIKRIEEAYNGSK